MSVTIRDIAEALKLNPATVSSCLAGNYRARRLSEKTAQRVKAKAEELGYIPNRLAGRIFGRSRRKNIALIFKKDTAGARSLPVLDQAIRFLGERSDCDFTVLYSPTANLQQALKNGIGLGIRDFVVIGYLRGRDLTQSQLEKLPPVKIYALDYYFDQSDRDFPSVVCKIGFDREQFYRKLIRACGKAGLGPVKLACAIEVGQPLPAETEPLTYQVEEVGDLFRFGREKIAPAVEKLVRAGKCRTLLLRNDSIAVGVMESLLSQGIRIPEDLALVGFNNAPFSAYAKVPLTTVELPQSETMEKLLLAILENTPVPPVIPAMPRLIFRQSAPEF